MMKNSILIISNNVEQAAMISEVCRGLLPAASDILCCSTYETAFGPLFMKRWDVVIVDMGMKGGLEIVNRVKLLIHNDQTRIMAFVKDSIDEVLFTEALSHGATHLLTGNDLRQPHQARLSSYFEHKAMN